MIVPVKTGNHPFIQRTLNSYFCVPIRNTIKKTKFKCTQNNGERNRNGGEAEWHPHRSTQKLTLVMLQVTQHKVQVEDDRSAQFPNTTVDVDVRKIKNEIEIFFLSNFTNFKCTIYSSVNSVACTSRGPASYSTSQHMTQACKSMALPTTCASCASGWCQQYTCVHLSKRTKAERSL